MGLSPDIHRHGGSSAGRSGAGPHQAIQGDSSRHILSCCSVIHMVLRGAYVYGCIEYLFNSVYMLHLIYCYSACIGCIILDLIGLTCENINATLHKHRAEVR